LAETLEKRGLHDAAIEQWKLILRLGDFVDWDVSESWNFTEAAREVGNELIHTDRMWSAVLHQRALLSVLGTGSRYLDIDSYISVVHVIHATRAFGLLEAGRLDEAEREAEQAQAAIPGGIGLVELLMVKFAAAGRPAAGERLFDTSWDAGTKICRDFPRSARHHHDLAALAVRCQRRLDDALAHALEAVRLKPENVAHLDTLAEIRFSHGEREEAVALAKRAVEREPNNTHLKQQLRRFQNAE